MKKLILFLFIFVYLFNLKLVFSLNSDFAYNVEVFTYRRVISKFKLHDIFPEVPISSKFKVNLKNQSFTNYVPEYKLKFIDDSIYFFTKFISPCKFDLSTKFFLNTTNKREVKQTITYDVKKLNFSINHIFKFKVVDLDLDSFFSSEESILNYFKDVLWSLKENVTNHNVNLVFLKPDGNDYYIEIGSDIDFTKTLSDFYNLVYKNPNQCLIYTIESSKLNEFKSKTNLNLDPCSLSTESYIPKNFSSPVIRYDKVDLNFEIEVISDTTDSNLIYYLISGTFLIVASIIILQICSYLSSMNDEE